MFRINYVFLNRVECFLRIISLQPFSFNEIEVFNDAICIVIWIVELRVCGVEHPMIVEELIDFAFRCAIVMTLTLAYVYTKASPICLSEIVSLQLDLIRLSNA